MSRVLIPGRVDRHGIARPFAGCTGGCSQGDAACDCGTELANVAPLRTHFPSPRQTRSDMRYLCCVVAIDVLALASMCVLIYFF